MGGCEDTEGLCCLVYGVSWRETRGVFEAKRLMSLEECGSLLSILACECRQWSLENGREVISTYLLTYTRMGSDVSGGMAMATAIATTMI